MTGLEVWYAMKDIAKKRTSAAPIYPWPTQELVRLNAPKVHNEWRQRLRAAKLEELKAEVKVMMDNHERAIDCRDALIQVTAQGCCSVT